MTREYDDDLFPFQYRLPARSWSARCPHDGLCTARPLAVSRLPLVDEASPLGVRRGITSRLTLRGSALSGNPRLVAPFRFVIETPTPGNSVAAIFIARITVDPLTPLGIYPVRVVTDDGLSDPFPLAVGQLPQIEEKEDNNNINAQANEADWTAQRITLPTVIEGGLPEDNHNFFRFRGKKDNRDFFRFRGKKGQRIVADIQCARLGSGIDTDLWLGSLDREYSQSVNPRFEDQADTPFFTLLPNDADYLFGVSYADHRPIKGGRRVYRLTIGPLPAAAEVYPLGVGAARPSGSSSAAAHSTA